MTDRGPARLRRINAARVLDALRAERASITLTELSRRAGVSRAAVESLAGELVHLGLVDSSSPERRGPGRPPREYAIRPGGGMIVGIDIGAHKTTALVSGLDLQVRGRGLAPSDPGLPTGARIAGALDAVRSALDEAGGTASAVRRIHVGTAGIVDGDGVIRRSGAIQNWTDAPVAEHLHRAYPSAGIRVDNDIRLAALAEQRAGAAAGADDVLHIHLGTRTGAALIIGGRAHVGRGGAAAEIGFLPAPYIGTRPGPAGPPLDAVTDVLRRAALGEQVARRAVDAYLDTVAERIQPLIVAVAPQVIVLGGGLTHARELVIIPLVERLRAGLHDDEVPIACAHYGDDGAAHGALCDAAATLPSAQLYDLAHDVASPANSG